MRIIRFNSPDYQEQIKALIERPAFDPAIELAVADILKDVQANGDSALVKYARKFDHVELKPAEFAISEDEFANAGKQLTPRIKKAIKTAHAQVREFARQRIPAPWSYSPRPGVLVGERFAPLDRVGVYVPGGTAPLISTVLHTATFAAVAGVREIVLVTPPGAKGAIHPAILYAAHRAGVTEAYRLGGVYAVAALAFGTETVRKVEKIVGPGNAYVTAAKKLVYGHTALDLVAGPSEIMIIADDSARADFIAADMLSQIEHGSGAENAVLLTTSEELLQATHEQLRLQVATRLRHDKIAKCLENGVHLVLVADLAAATELASQYAPEHLEIMARRPGALAKKVTAAGAVFLGPWTPEPVGDFVAGPSHVLPTGGAARFFSGLTVEQFFRRMSVVNYQKSALLREQETLEVFAEIEGLDSHGKCISIRLGDSE